MTGAVAVLVLLGLMVAGGLLLAARLGRDEAEGDGLPRASGSSIFLEARQPGATTRIDRFDAGRDELVVLYDAARHPAPAVTVRRLAAAGESLVLLDGQPLAVVAAGAARLDPAQIRLVSAAA